MFVPPEVFPKAKTSLNVSAVPTCASTYPFDAASVVATGVAGIVTCPVKVAVVPVNGVVIVVAVVLTFNAPVPLPNPFGLKKTAPAPVVVKTAEASLD